MNNFAAQLVLIVLPALVKPEGFNEVPEDGICEDPLSYDPRLEIVHLYKSRSPAGIAVSSNGRKFSCYPASYDATNTNNGRNGAYQLAELISFDTDRPYPNVAYNNPPGGAIDFTQTPPITKGLTNYFLGVQSVVIDFNNRMWVVDTGRVLYNGTILLASPGGAKLIQIDLTTNTVTRTYIFPTTVSKPNSYFDDVRVDTTRHFAYLADSNDNQDNALIVLDLSTGRSRRVLDQDPRVRSIPGVLPFFWGEPLYLVFLSQSGTLVADHTTYGVDGIALSNDTDVLYFSVVGGRFLYSVPTSLLRDPNTPSGELAAAVQNLSEKGVSDGIVTDSLGAVYGGNLEQSAVSMYDPNTEKTVLFVKDKRINWVDSLCVAEDRYLYFTVNQLNFSPLIWPGQGPLRLDRRRKPYVLFRARLPRYATKGQGS